MFYALAVQEEGDSRHRNKIHSTVLHRLFQGLRSIKLKVQQEDDDSSTVFYALSSELKVLVSSRVTAEQLLLPQHNDRKVLQIDI